MRIRHRCPGLPVSISMITFYRTRHLWPIYMPAGIQVQYDGKMEGFWAEAGSSMNRRGRSEGSVGFIEGPGTLRAAGHAIGRRSNPVVIVSHLAIVMPELHVTVTIRQSA